MAKPRTTLSMDIDLKAGGTLRIDLLDDGRIRRQQTPAVNTLTISESTNIQAVEKTIITLIDLIEKLT